MLKHGVFLLAIPLFAAAVGCTNSPMSPSAGGGANHAGEWSGTTSQGTAIAFTVSADEKVTSITIGHRFNGCSGSQTFSNLSLPTAPDVICIPGPCSGSIASYRAFHYAATSSDGGVTSINALFTGGNVAEGLVAFRDFPGCGTSSSNPWMARKR